jgi:hypothetical protein
MRSAGRIGLVAMAIAQLAGCRDVLDIRDRPLVEDAGVADAMGVDAAETGPPTFCETLMPAAQHCADFERGELLAGWDAQLVVPDPAVHGGGALEELRDASGRKLLVTTPAKVATGDKAGANLFLMLPVRPTRLLVKAEMTVVTEDHQPDNEALVIQLVFGDEGAVVIYRDLEGAAAAVVPGGKAVRFPSWPAGTPHTIGLSVDNEPVRGPDGVADASIDGVLSPELLVPAHFQKAGPPRVIIGLRTFAPVGPMKLVVDDVAIYWK